MLSHIEKVRAVATASAVLGVSPHASEDEVRKAWKRRAFELHPDRGVGTNNDLIEINQAYELMRTRRISEPVGGWPGSETQNQTPRPRTNVSKPLRPTVRTRVDAVGVKEARCADCFKVESGHGATDHVPHAIERTGRRVTYIIATPASSGTNRVAVPTGFLVDARKVAPVIVSVETATGGVLTYQVPEHLRASLFPQAAQVTIVFGQRT